MSVIYLSGCSKPLSFLVYAIDVIFSISFEFNIGYIYNSKLLYRYIR